MLSSKRQERTMGREIIAALIGAAFIFFCNRSALFAYWTIAAAAVFMTATSCLLFETDAVSAFSVTSFYLLCLNCFDFLMLTLLSSLCGSAAIMEHVIADMSGARAGVILLIKGLWALIYLILRKYIEKISVSIRETALLFVLSAAGFAGFVYLAALSRKAFQNTFPILWFGAVCLLAALIFIGYFKTVNQEQKWKLEMLGMRHDLLNENYQEIHQIYEENARLYHDLDSHLNVLYQLMDEERTEDAKNYIREISHPIRKLSKNVWTGMDVADAVVNSEMHRMEELGIRFEIHAEIFASGSILASDLCIILSNLLDNAIEACCLCEKDMAPYITLTIRRIHHFIMIRVVNPLTRFPEKNRKTGQLQTTKKDRQAHGWGLKSVRSAVEKYHGTLEQEWNEQEFETTVLLFE